LGDTAFVEVEPGVRLFTRLVGDGPQTVVIPAGFFLERPLSGLADGRRLIFYDMRDRGRSDSVPDASRVGIRQDIDDLEALREHFALERMNLIGWSYLGLMVAMYTFEHPERVERLVQIGPIPPRSAAPYQKAAGEALLGVLDPAELTKLQELAESGVRESDPQRFYEAYWRVYKPTLFGDRAKMAWYELPPSDLPNEWLHNLEPHIQAKVASFGDFDYRAEAARLNVPVLTIHGTADLNAPIEGGREWSAAFPQGRFLPVDGAAHLAMVEQPELVQTAIDVFLRGYWPEGAVRIEAGN
jgi:proline iminopeptidase